MKEVLFGKMSYAKLTIILAILSVTVILTVHFWEEISSMSGLENNLYLLSFYALFIVPLQIFFPIGGAISGAVAIFSERKKALVATALVCNLSLLGYAFVFAQSF